MDARLGWLLAAAAVAVAWWGYGWPGLVLAATVIAFWLLLQFSRTLRLLRGAASAPVGHVPNAVMFHAKLRERMPLADVIRAAGSLGRKTSDQPETFAWTDAGDVRVEVELRAGRCAAWRLRRPDAQTDGAGIRPSE
jgi:hypothetical protein